MKEYWTDTELQALVEDIEQNGPHPAPEFLKDEILEEVKRRQSRLRRQLFLYSVEVWAAAAVFLILMLGVQLFHPFKEIRMEGIRMESMQSAPSYRSDRSGGAEQYRVGQRSVVQMEEASGALVSGIKELSDGLVSFEWTREQ